MAKGQSPLLGYNTNVRHKGRTYHIQTEDSGVSHPHVITHLFADGGRIIKSNKTPYGELLETPDWATQVKKIMQDQHKAMFIALRDGQYDHLIEVNDVGKANITGQLPALQSPTAPAPASTGQAASAGTTGTSPASVAGQSPVRAPSASSLGAVKAPAAPTANPSGGHPTAGSASSTGANPSVPAQSRPLAPSVPPASRAGGYSAVRSPDVLGSFKGKDSPANASASIFGDGMMSEKSLDEVILAYLAEDLDDKKI